MTGASRKGVVAVVAMAALTAMLIGDRLERPLGDLLLAALAPAASDDVVVGELFARTTPDEVAQLLGEVGARGPAAIGLMLPRWSPGVRGWDTLTAALAAAPVPVILAGGPDDSIPAAIRTAPASPADGTLPPSLGLPPFPLAVAEAVGGPTVTPPGRVVHAGTAIPVRTAAALGRIAGKVVLLGPREPRVRVPPGVPGAMEGTLPAVVQEAHILSQLLTGVVRWAMPNWTLPVAAVLSAVLALALRGPVALVAGPILVASLLALVWATPITPPVLTPCLGFAVACAGLASRRRVLAAGERCAARAELSRFMPGEAAARIAAGGSAPPERRDVTHLVVAAGGIAARADTASPFALAEAMSAAIGGAVEAVLAAGGTVTGTAGDTVAAVFGAPEWQGDHAARALAAANAIAARQTALPVAIAVHTGYAVVGLAGARFIAAGTSVDVALRLSEAARSLGLGIIVSERSRERAPGPSRAVGRLALGPHAAILCHQPHPPDPAYDAAFRALASASPRAKRLFESLDRTDPLIALHRARIEAGATDDLIAPAQAVWRSSSAAPSETETSWLTPFSTMVTP